jgi:hypothetical protein
MTLKRMHSAARINVVLLQHCEDSQFPYCVDCLFLETDFGKSFYKMQKNSAMVILVTSAIAMSLCYRSSVCPSVCLSVCLSD